MEMDGSESLGKHFTLKKEILIEKDELPPEPVQFKFSLLSRDQKVVIASVSVACLLNYLSLSIMAPFFPKEADEKNVDGTVSGWIFGIMSLVKCIVSPFYGKLIPRMGSKAMLLCGIFTCGVFTLCFGVLDRIDVSGGNLTFITLCFVTRILLAIGCSSISTSSFVVFVLAFPDNVPTVFGIVEVSTGVGMVIGPALGGVLYDAGGFILPFAVVGVSCLLIFPLVWVYLPSQNETQSEERGGVAVSKVLLQSKTIINSIVIALGAASWSVLDPTLEPHLRVFGFSPSFVGLMFLILAAVYSMTAPIFGRISEKMSDLRPIMMLGLLLEATGFLLAGPSPALGFDINYNAIWLTVISLVLLGIAATMTLIPTFNIYMDVLSDIGYPRNTQTYSLVSGLWVSVYAFGEFAGPSLGGSMNEYIGFEWLTTAFAAANIMTSLVVAISWAVEKKHRQYNPSRNDIEQTPLIQREDEDDIGLQ